MSSLERLAERVRHDQDRALTHGAAWKSARRELQRRGKLDVRSAGVPRQVKWALAAVPLALGLGLALRSVSSGEAERLSAIAGGVVYEPGDALLAPRSAPLPIDFSDGSSVVLAPSSVAQVDDLGRHGAQVSLSAGEAQVHVVHRDHTNWLLNVGPFRVRVTGTRFAVHYNPADEMFELSMAEGSVIVTGCTLGDRGRKVVANETLRATCRPPQAASADELPSEATASGPVQLVADVPSEPPPARREGPTPRPTAHVAAAEPEPPWLPLARGGEYADAYAQLSPIFESELALRGPEELTLMADVARLSGHWDRAEHAYRTLRSRFANTSRAASAAFSLARLAFDQRQSYSEAARWFQIYLDEEPSGPFAREALGRRVEALHRASDTRAARSEAARYLQLYPGGPHARAVRGLLAGP
jgi:hypothetical protein